MALSYDASVKAALDAALPGQKLTDADYHWWTNNGGAAAVQSQWAAPAPAPAPASNDFVVGGGGSGPAPSPAPAPAASTTATSAYSGYLSNPSSIPRMSGETEADALARVQGWHDSAVSRTNNSNQIRQQYNTLNAGAPNFTPMDMRSPGVPLPSDNYVSGSGQPAESVMRLIGDSSYTPRTGSQTVAPTPVSSSQNGFTAGGGGTVTGSGGAGAPSGLVGGAYTGGAFQQWDVTAPQTVQSQAAAIANADGTLMQQARGRAMQAMNERGLVNSTLAIQAGQDAVLDRAIQIAQQDAATNAEAAKFNAGQSNAWTLAQQELAEKASQFTRELAAKYDLAKFDLESRQSLAATEREYQQQLATDKAFQDQYQMYVDALFKIDSDPELSAEAKTARKQEQLDLLKNYASIRGLNLSQYLTFSPAASAASTSTPATGLVSQADGAGI